MEHGHVYGVPFQNSTPLLYYSVDAFKDAGLDPDHPPVTWQDWVDDMRKLAKHDGAQTSRWGLMFPGTYDYLRLDHQRLRDVERRRILQHRLRRRGLLQRAHHHRRGDASSTPWCTSGT